MPSVRMQFWILWTLILVLTGPGVQAGLTGFGQIDENGRDFYAGPELSLFAPNAGGGSATSFVVQISILNDFPAGHPVMVAGRSLPMSVNAEGIFGQAEIVQRQESVNLSEVPEIMVSHNDFSESDIQISNVPEPMTIVIFGLGSLFVLRTREKSR